MADLKIDTDDLRDAAGILATVTVEFNNANSRLDTAIGAAGHWVLEQAISDFAGSWDQHRKELVEQMDGLSDILLSAADTIDEADELLASNLEGEG